MKKGTQLEPGMLAEVRLLGMTHQWKLLLWPPSGHVGSIQVRKSPHLVFVVFWGQGCEGPGPPGESVHASLESHP